MDDRSTTRFAPRVIVVVAALLLSSAGLAGAVGVFDNGNDSTAPYFEAYPAADPPPATPPSTTTTVEQASGLALLQAIQDSFRQVAAAVMPVVVKIDTTVSAGSVRRSRRSPQAPREFWQQPPDFGEPPPDFGQPPPEFGQPGGTGSGIIVSNSGTLYYVLTNNHVIANSESITVTLDDGRDFDAQLVGRDPRQDIAVVSFRGPRGLPIARLGDSGRLMVGDLVLAVGSPFGFQSTVTSGIVSALERETSGNLDGGINIAQYIQTDAAINPGNSGGALVNLRGEVIGVNTWIASRGGGSVGVGFALPINAAKRGIRDLIESGAVRYGYLGVFVSSASNAMRKALGVTEVDGALAWSVIEKSPAARGDLRPGDWVTRVDGEAVGSSAELIRAVGALEPGRESRFDVIRDGKPVQLRLRVALRDDSDDRTPRNWPGIFPVHIFSEQLTDEAREQFGLGNRRGVLVGQVHESGAAAAAGFRRRDFITHIDGDAIRDAADFYRALVKGDANEYLVSIVRNRQEMTITLRP